MTKLRIELEAARTDAGPRAVVLSAPDDVTAGAALDVLGAHLGLTSAAGAVEVFDKNLLVPREGTQAVRQLLAPALRRAGRGPRGLG